MIEIKKYLIDFAEGRISVSDFIEYSKEHPEILDFLTNIADPKFKMELKKLMLIISLFCHN